MKTPRLALLALCSLLASFAAAEDPGWTPKVQSGTAWTSVTFKIESGESKTYWFRSDAKGPTAPLYALKLEKQDPKNPSVVGSALFSSAVTVYTIKTAYGPDRYTVTQAGRPKFSPRGTITGTKGAATIVVTSPGSVPEKLDPSPITVYTPNLAPIKWEDYYYTKTARKPEYLGLYDPDGDYREAQASFGHLHRRVLPFELMFSSDNCFVRPETCTKAKDPNFARYTEAASEASKGNLLLVKPLAEKNHKEYAEAATKFKAALDGGAADKFSEPENSLLEKLLVENKLLPAFQAEMIKARAKPETLKQFVAKWRTYLKAEIDVYLKESAAAGQDEIKHAVNLAAMRDRITKTAALPLKPAAGPNTPTKPVIDPATGKPKPGDVAAKPKPGAFKINPEDLLWRDKVTPIGSWRAVATETQIPGASAKDFYCYHVKMTAAEKIAAHLIKNKTVMVECVDWAAPKDPKDDVVQTEGKTKFKVRAAKTKFNLAAVKGKLTIVNDDGSPAGVGGALTEKTAPTAATVATHVKVTLAPSAPDAPAMLLLSPHELTWLEKTRSAFYGKNIPKEPAALEAFRNEIVKNLDEDKAAIAKYEKARKEAKSNADLDKELRDVWGGKDNMEIVALAGSRTEIQLSPEDHKALLALPGTAARDYDEKRGLADGGRKTGKAYNSVLYDPILLHQTVRAALKALGKTDAAPVVAPKPDENAVVAKLDDKELELLTKKEKDEYLAMVKSANGKYEDTNVQKMIKALRAKIAAEERGKAPAYVEPKNLKEFKALKEWQQRKFCDGLPKPLSTVEKDARGEEVDNANPDALAGAENTAGKPVTQPKKTPPPAEDKVDPALRKACAALAPEAATVIDPSDKGPKKEPAAAANIVNGEDVNGPKEKENKWLTKPLIASASKGALVGLILGSLFGPIGLIAGPIIGGVFFYGLNKMADMKAEKEKEKE